MASAGPSGPSGGARGSRRRHHLAPAPEGVWTRRRGQRTLGVEGTGGRLGGSLEPDVPSPHCAFRVGHAPSPSRTHSKVTRGRVPVKPRAAPSPGPEPRSAEAHPWGAGCGCPGPARRLRPPSQRRPERVPGRLGARLPRPRPRRGCVWPAGTRVRLDVAGPRARGPPYLGPLERPFVGNLESRCLVKRVLLIQGKCRNFPLHNTREARHILAGLSGTTDDLLTCFFFFFRKYFLNHVLASNVRAISGF